MPSTRRAQTLRSFNATFEKNQEPFSKLNSKLVTVIAIENENLNLFHPTSFDNTQHTFQMFMSTL